MHVKAWEGAVPAAGHAGTEGQAQDLAQAPVQQLGTLSMLLSEKLQEAAHESSMHVCLPLLLPCLPLLLHLLCSASHATVRNSHTHNDSGSGQNASDAVNDDSHVDKIYSKKMGMWAALWRT